ncbi:MAG: hypothetical protein JXA37_09670 [Chloroflexia bacterium]|nr:hypothetical protein [Chloroflexia bacterium]
MPEERDEGKGLKGRSPGGIGGRIGKEAGDRGQQAEKMEQVRSAMQSGARQSASAASAGPGVEGERVTLEQRASTLQDELNRLRNQANMAGLRDRLEDLDSSLSDLPAAMDKLRQQGYVYKGYMENKIEVLREQWQGLGQRIDQEAAQQGRQLAHELDNVQRRLSSMGSRLNEATLASLERESSALASKIESVHSSIAGLFDTIENNASQTRRQLQTIQWTLDQVAEASFRLRVDENVIEATEAQYLTEEKDGPQGILYLSDQRFIFEQKEDVATKKILFITTEKERVQKVLLEAPIGSIEKAQPREKRALVRMKEQIEITFGPQAPVTLALFQLKTDSDPWQALIGRIISGDIDRERVGAAAPPAPAAAKEGVPAPAAEAPAPAAPTACPTCGANITTDIVRGMRSVTCEYCGTVIRL